MKETARGKEGKLLPTVGEIWPQGQVLKCVWGLFYSLGQGIFSVVFKCLANELITRDKESSLGPLVGSQHSLDLSTDPDPVDEWPWTDPGHCVGFFPSPAFFFVLPQGMEDGNPTAHRSGERSLQNRDLIIVWHTEESQSTLSQDYMARGAGAQPALTLLSISAENLASFHVVLGTKDAVQRKKRWKKREQSLYEHSSQTLYMQQRA